MRVKDIIVLLGGNTKVRMVGTDEEEKFVDVWSGKVDDINFDKIPCGNVKVEDMSVIEGEDNLLINLDSSLNARSLLPRYTCPQCGKVYSTEEEVIQCLEEKDGCVFIPYVRKMTGVDCWGRPEFDDVPGEKIYKKYADALKASNYGQVECKKLC